MEIFNSLIRYEIESEIPIIELSDQYWISKVENVTNSNSYIGIVEFNDRILELVAANLNFGEHQVISNPNDLRKSTAHCVGYASLNSSLLNYYCKNTTYQISHVRGKVYFLGIDLTKLSNSKFFNNHDFVRINHKVTGKEYFSDGSIYEFLKIKRIGLKYGM